ncbi:MAG: ATP-binding protein [Bacteroidetes bacterium]|nr:ATP-binding protein [Bacteroidota bacterium]
MSNTLVEYSRAGDVFHYRWAARRCLQLVYPHAKVKKIVIEGSDDPTKEGEYVIDVTEYSGESGQECIDYYQLKHSTVQIHIPFTLSDLQSTVTGFAKRYSEWKDKDSPQIAFTVITNRKVADSFRDGLKAIADGNPADVTFKSTIEKYTGLKDDDLRGFCKVFFLVDSEGDYDVQQEELKSELSKLVADPVDQIQVLNLVGMIQERVLPNTRNTIVREDVLKRFGITSERQLFPAPAELEPAPSVIELSQYKTLKEKIDAASTPVIVHAEGGVGKSVFCRHLVSSLPSGSIGIIYDCFGSGKYRNRSEHRHCHRQALTQIVNELAAKGLCSPLLLSNSSRDQDIVRTFLERVEAATQSLRKIVASAKLFILLDAADNAEMAALEFNDNCFAHELIREQMPTGCQLVFLCRTERVHLLQPSGNVLQLPLNPFSEPDTLRNLSIWFPMATEHDGREFHRLTNANPRVQANALSAKYETIQALLASLGPGGMSVEKLIESQLDAAVNKIKHHLSIEYQQQITSICLGLAILPPHIPISVLARASQVDESTIKSFVSDIGRSLWILDSSVQFRDEPTETWFRNKFLGKKADFVTCVQLLEPLANDSTYVSEILPNLYLQAEQYEKLIQASLGDDFLPTNNPIDARTIRVYRLQFAFKAALKTKKIADAIKVAIKAGEEVAGNQRQLGLLQENIDLLVKLQSKEKVQELAFKQQLGGAWDGSENIYTASLLSGITEYKGEARGYLRSGMNWLRISLEESRKRGKEDRHFEERITERDILETAYAMLNLEGADACIEFLNHLNPRFVFEVLQHLTIRLMDEGRFDEIDQLLCKGQTEVHYTVAIISKLATLGKIPNSTIVAPALDLLCDPERRIEIPEVYHYEQGIHDAIATFADCCLALHLSSEKILQVLEHYIPTRASRSVGNERFSNDRPIFLKALAIRMTLSGQPEPNLEEILPLEYLKEKKSYDEQNALTEFKEVLLGLLPWYLFRIRILVGEKASLMDAAYEVQQISSKARGQRYRSHDQQPGEIALVCSSIATLLKDFPPEDIRKFYDSFLKPKETLSLWGRLNLLNAAGRLAHLTLIRPEIEQATHEIVKSVKGDGPDDIASRYLALARAVLIVDTNDARFYFDKAIDVASKFGDEIVQRWEALVGLAEQASNKTVTSNALAYRFIRCAEIVGDTVAREKYWSRYDAMRVCAKMSPGMGLSAASRWRDRDIGTFQYELMAVVNQLLDTNKIDSSIAWSMSHFFSQQIDERFLTRCLVKTDLQPLRRAILQDYVRLNRIDGVEISYWSKIELIASAWIDDKSWIKDMFSFLDAVPDQPAREEQIEPSRATDSTVKWENIFNDVDMLTTDGFAEIVNRYLKQNGEDRYMRVHDLLIECMNRLNPAKLEEFINILLASPQVNQYEIQGVLESIPSEWRQKVSFPSKWDAIIRKVSERYAYQLSNSYGFDSFVRAIKADEKLKTIIIDGINAGLVNTKDLDSGETFFAYAKLSARCVTEAEARHLLDYALQRFELHIDSDVADGEWSGWLEVPESINHNLAGVVWSALGSPRATERWCAAHCILKLVEFNCSSVIHEIMIWADHNKVDAFGSRLFPFYNLHALQYLLIALARASKDYPDRLNKYNSLLKKFALESDHILIQKFASDTCLNIEAKLPGTFDPQTIDGLSKITKSKFPIMEEKKYDFRTDSYWHANRLIDENVEFHFAWDFDRYWYQPLGDVFGISEKQIEDLSAVVLVKEWKKDYDGKHVSDPRVGIWNRYSSERETWHNHGSYPKVDDLDFYLSYHAMLVVAGRLLQKMPVLSSSYGDGNAWENWLSRHLLTRTDGKWLADHRDSVPVLRPTWVFAERQGFDEWKSSITEMDFINYLTSIENNRWLTVKGGWHEKKSERIETVYISSAWVSREASDALLRAWTTSSDPHDYKVPDYGEEDMEFDSGIFNLSGWIIDPNSEHELDEFDPFANKVEYPSYKIGQSILDLLTVRGDAEGKKWFNEKNECIASCASWVCSHSDRDEEADQAGMRLTVDLKTVQRLCQELNQELIIKISITRRLSYSHRSRQQEERDIENEQHRIFILNEHGELRTIGKNYRPG